MRRKKQADLVIALETDIANNKLTVQEQYDVDKTFNPPILWRNCRSWWPMRMSGP